MCGLCFLIFSSEVIIVLFMIIVLVMMMVIILIVFVCEDKDDWCVDFEFFFIVCLDSELVKICLKMCNVCLVLI